MRKEGERWTYRSHHIRHENHQQADICQNEEEAKQGDHVRSDP